jgi:hypothetical protein
MAPIFPIGIGAAAFLRYFSAVGAQSRTQIARDDLRIQSLQSSGCGHEGILLPPTSAALRIAVRCGMRLTLQATERFAEHKNRYERVPY